MTQIDRELITKKLQELKDYLGKLNEFRGMNKAKFVSDHHHYGLAEHYLQLSIESVLDICRHLVLALDLKTPDDAHGLLPLLTKENVISKNFAERNLKMPGFRNRLVHGYADINHEKTFEYLNEHLNDLHDFVSQISQYLLKAEKS